MDLPPLPLVLAGPILRRVEKNLVSVWLALSEPREVTLSVWDGRVEAGTPLPLASGAATQTLRVGDQLHVVVVIVKLTEAEPLKAGHVYSYDLTFKKESETQTLKSLGLLKDEPGRRLALGFETDMLPSFATCPPELKDLRVAHGSCRRASANLPDGLAWVDEVLLAKDEAFKNPLLRPHQLFLTGDQIYADDVSRAHLLMLNKIGRRLISSRKDAAGGPFTAEQLPAAGKSFPADLVHFPAGFRLTLTRNEAGMTSNDGHSHLLSLGEFAAMYLTVWNNECWDDDAFADVDGLVPVTAQDSRPWFERLKAGGETELLRALLDPTKEEDLAKVIEDAATALEAARGRHREEVETLKRFRATLPRVRRALANVPTYMMFDDHEVTDDWYLNFAWRDRVLGSQLGMAVIRNGMLAYALFQGWGNDPVKFGGGDAETGVYKELLESAARLFREGADSGPDREAAGKLDDLMGVNLRNTVGAGGHFAETNPPVKWHYSVPGEQHLVHVLDCRTRRSFETRMSPPGNISTLRFASAAQGAADAQKEQLPPGPLPQGKEVLFVVASLQVLGPPVFDELLAPLLVRVFDTKDFDDLQKSRGSKAMPGTNPDAVEGWAFDPKTFEALLERMATYRRVVILSGDVHYAASNVMSYWKKGDQRPAQIVQFTSSGLQNFMNEKVILADRSFAFAQRMIRSKIGAARLAWEQASRSTLSFVGNPAIPPRLDAKRDQSPMLLPTRGWPAGTIVSQAAPPDWSWLVTILRDERPHDQRPAPARPFTLFPDDDSKKDADIADNSIDGYHRTANRHARQLEKLNHGRQILFVNNLGLVTFGRMTVKDQKCEQAADVLAVTHDLYAAQPDPDVAEPSLLKPEVYARHVAPLEHPFIKPPELGS